MFGIKGSLSILKIESVLELALPLTIIYNVLIKISMIIFFSGNVSTIDTQCIEEFEGVNSIF